VRVGKFHFAALGRAMAAGDTTGFVKWVADADTDRLLGAHAVGPRATELVAEAAAAIRAELTLEEIGRTVHCHPTFSEAWMEAAHAAHGLCIHAAPKRRR
jgi:dihydrolipoamide dehydrogenase